MRRFSLLICAVALLPWTPNFRLAPPMDTPPNVFKGYEIPLDEYQPTPSERRCSTQERRLCESACQGQGFVSSALKTCRVRTVEGRMTAVCTCFDPNLEV